MTTTTGPGYDVRTNIGADTLSVPREVLERLRLTVENAHDKLTDPMRYGEHGSNPLPVMLRAALSDLAALMEATR